jgi:hypothetical protein
MFALPPQEELDSEPICSLMMSEPTSKGKVWLGSPITVTASLDDV